MLREQRALGAEVCVFGDIDIEGHFAWCSERCRSAGVIPCFPLWKETVAHWQRNVLIAATIPADIAQYYGYMLRATQKLMYLYGFPQIDVEENGQVFDSETMNLLILCMGVMYGVVGANNALKAVAKALGTGVEKQLLRRALTKGTIYPIVKSVSKWFGVRMTKQIFAGVFKKAIPVVGGVLGGGITYLSFKPCCDKLKASLQNTILSNPDYQNSETEDAILAEFADVTTSGYETVPGTV